MIKRVLPVSMAFMLLGSFTAIVQANDNTETITDVQQKIISACPRYWENYYSAIELNPKVLNIWQGDLADKAEFVAYADSFLKDDDGKLLIAGYDDTVTIITECGAQRVKLYKMIREQIGAELNSIGARLDSYTVFKNSAINSGLEYGDWIEDSTPEEEEVVLTPGNIAFGKYTTQSGTSNDALDDEQALADLSEDEIEQLSENQGHSAKAVDTNTDGIFSNGSVTHTGITNEPYWQVDLDSISQIHEIKVYSRTDCCAEKLSQFTLMLSTEALTKKRHQAAVDQADKVITVTSSEFSSSEISAILQQANENPEPISQAHIITKADLGGEPVLARYVRIQIPKNETVLSLAEVEVIGIEGTNNDL